MVRGITKFAKDTITVNRYDEDWNKTVIYENIAADVQLRAYNISDFTSTSTEVENTQKYYIMINRTKKNIRSWDYIIWTSDLDIEKTLLITSLSMERFLSRSNLIEIRAEDYVNNS